MQKIDYLSKNGAKKLKENMVNYVETHRCDIITADDINQWFDEIFYTAYIKIPKGTSLTISKGTYGFSAVSDQPYTTDIKISAVVYGDSLLAPGAKTESGTGGDVHYKSSFSATGIEFSNSSEMLGVRLFVDGDNFDLTEDSETTQIGLYHDILIYYTTKAESDQQIYTYTVDTVSDNKLSTPGQYGFELPYGFSYPEPYTIVSIRDENGRTDYETSQYTTTLNGEEIVCLLILPQSGSSAPTKFDIRLKHAEV